jgi:TonB family protein
MKISRIGVLIAGFGLTAMAESTEMRVVNLPETVVTENIDTLALKTVTPIYPQEMARTATSGHVTAVVTVNEHGNVVRVGILESSQRLFADAAEEALRQWQFNRADIDRRYMIVPIRFDLPGIEPVAMSWIRPGVIVTATIESQVVRAVDPVYPTELNRQNKSGKVVLDATVNQEGRVIGISVIEATDSGFAQAAKDALWKWAFVESDSPLPNGRRHVHVPIRFVAAGS